MKPDPPPKNPIPAINRRTGQVDEEKKTKIHVNVFTQLITVKASTNIDHDPDGHGARGDCVFAVLVARWLRCSIFCLWLPLSF